MSTPNKTVGTSLITHQLSTNHLTDASGFIVGSAVNTLYIIRADVYLYHAFVQSTGNTNGQKWLIQGSAATSGNGHWFPIQTVNIAFTGTPLTESLTDGPFAVGAKALDVALTLEYVAGDGVYIIDAGTLADSEWAIVDKVVTDVTVDLVDGLTNAKDSSDALWDNPQMDKVTVELEGVNRIRVLYFNRAAGANTHIKANMTTLDSYSA